MIEYIQNKTHGSTIFYQDKEVYSKRSAIYEIKNLCIQHFFSYEGYIESVKKLTQERKLIPVVMDDEHSFLPTSRVRDYENIWINVGAIYQLNPKNNEVEIVFYSGRKLYVRHSLNYLKNKIKVAMKIKSMKVNIFIFNHVEITSK